MKQLSCAAILGLSLVATSSIADGILCFATTTGITGLEAQEYYIDDDEGILILNGVWRDSSGTNSHAVRCREEMDGARTEMVYYKCDEDKLLGLGMINGVGLVSLKGAKQDLQCRYREDLSLD